jgi:hypothetical protein
MEQQAGGLTTTSLLSILRTISCRGRLIRCGNSRYLLLLVHIYILILMILDWRKDRPASMRQYTLLRFVSEAHPDRHMLQP